MTEEPISGAFCYADSIIIARLKAEVERWRTKAKDANAALHNERAAITRREAEVRAEADDLRRKNAAGSNQVKVMRDHIAKLEKVLGDLMSDWPEHKEWYCASGNPCAWCRARALIKEQP